MPELSSERLIRTAFSGYEPDELPLLHPRDIKKRIFLTLHLSQFYLVLNVLRVISLVHNFIFTLTQKCMDYC